jgi:hypothetical protein
MFAHVATLTNSYAGPKIEPFECEAHVLAEGSDTESVSNAESLKLAKGFLTAIDFEVTAAFSLCGSWQADRKSEVFLLRTLGRIADHLKALKAAQATVDQFRDVNPHSAPRDPAVPDNGTSWL